MDSSNLSIAGNGPDAAGKDYGYFKREFYDISGIQLNFYKEKQMKRRIDTLIERRKCSGYEDFISLLRSSSFELASFIDYITINVSEFFRTPAHWSYLESSVLPELLLHSDKCLKIWSCACSTGEEPYSLAISLLRLADPSRFRIIATDIDARTIAKAREGFFDIKQLSALSEETLSRYFVCCDSAKYQASEQLRGCVEFRQLDLLKDPYPSDCDLIVCRNVLIYFTEEAKERIYSLFKDSLKQGGYLFTGNTEQIIYYKRIGFRKLENYMYLNE